MSGKDLSDQAKDPFGSPLVETVRTGRNAGILEVSGSCIILPRVFGFCSGVRNAVIRASAAVVESPSKSKLILLGEIIHNPWVNDYFRRQGISILSPLEKGHLADFISPEDIVIIPAFGAHPDTVRLLKDKGCDIIDCTCGDVRRLWKWSEQAVGEGYGVIVYGRPGHIETIVTRARLDEAGGKYLVLENLQQAEDFVAMIREDRNELAGKFGTDATNAESLDCFLKAAQVSQTTMLYDETMKFRAVLEKAFVERFGENDTLQRLKFQPTVCRATQDRQNAARELCENGCDLVIVVGGFKSSNTANLYKLAGRYVPAFLVEDAESIISANRIHAWNEDARCGADIRNWLPEKRPLRIGVLTGASTPDVVTGLVLERLSQLLGRTSTSPA